MIKLKNFKLGIYLLIITTTVHAQTKPSTKDLDFLLGEWQFERIHFPNTDSTRISKGKFTCSYELDEQFIRCTYRAKRVGQRDVIDRVYFNYNHIYGLYESVWLSSTWPIKGIMQSKMSFLDGLPVLNSQTEFFIENRVREYVKGELVVSEKGGFQRETYIRLSTDKPGYWRHHMTEFVHKNPD